jgi:hypothetical protein
MQGQSYLAFAYIFLLTSPSMLLVAAVDIQDNYRQVGAGGSDEKYDDGSGEEGDARDKRFAMAVPAIYWGITAAPALYWWLVGLFGVTAIAAAHITMSNSSTARRKVYGCYGRNLGSIVHAHNCKNRGGQCCAADKSGTVNPFRIVQTGVRCGYCFTNGPGNFYP